ncbi:inositol monophosphatase [candidate division LCP-89 bacterium B3_LCP]|uniref:Inositol-1-monophosphatase n=1 Tax=candidate division LCP-89 bacterium B3_LCP TaxID=2012998 RepID=A0A532UZU1_UNCL8|nr:MAG: inositol monophosphatase [candidate division LCP-89 bacterium B3_LCP]
MKDLIDISVEAVRLGGDVLNRHFGKVDISKARAKGTADYVSDVDRESEETMRAFLLKELPDSTFLGEEMGQDDEGKSYRWIVDPLDGTTNYLQRLSIFGVSAALERCIPGSEWGEIIAGAVFHPPTGDLWTAFKEKGAYRNGERITVSKKQELTTCLIATGFPFRAKDELGLYLKTFEKIFLRCSGIRRAGAASLDLCWTAEGVFDGFWEHRLSPWDIAAGGLIIKEAGGLFTSFRGDNIYLSAGNVVGANPHLHPALIEIIKENVGDS